MPERGAMEPIVERVVAEVLESHTVQLRQEIVRRVMEEVEATPQESPQEAAPSSGELARTVAEIRAGTTQKEILRALLDGCARYAARVALFVVKAGSATGWQARGFSSSDAVKDFSLNVSEPALSRAIGERLVVETTAGDFDARFLGEMTAPAQDEIRLLPLVLKDKVAALVYADGGSDSSHHLDAGSLEVLVMATSSWLELNSLRKQARKEVSEPATERAFAPAAASAFNDPFAAHAPGHAMAAAATAEAAAPARSAALEAPVMSVVAEPEPAVIEAEPVIPEAAPVSEAEPAAAAVPAASAEDQGVHQKARRFARLLVDEVKLYNQAKVAEGRKNKDLYDRLKEAIEKSRSTYQKRYGNTVAASGNYFQHELMRSLAEDDLSIMGANFPH